MPNATIYSAGSELGKFKVTTREMLEEARFDDCNIVEKSLGIKEVRHTEASLNPSELAIPAGSKAIASAGIEPSAIDAVVYCGIERDCSEPATAHIIASALGLNPDTCFDVANACHGFTSGLQICNALIKTGAIKYALVVTAELSSKVTREVVSLFRKGELGADDIRNHIGAFTVGDAGGAMVLGPCSEDKGIDKIGCGTSSQYHNLCTYKFNQGKLSFNMEMGKISAVTLKLVKKLIGPTYRDLNWKPEDVDLLIPHQVGERPYFKALEMFGIGEDKSIATYPKMGNLASATVPVCFDFLAKQGRIQSGKKLLMGTTGSGIVASIIGVNL